MTIWKRNCFTYRQNGGYEPNIHEIEEDDDEDEEESEDYDEDEEDEESEDESLPIPTRYMIIVCNLQFYHFFFFWITAFWLKLFLFGKVIQRSNIVWNYIMFIHLKCFIDHFTHQSFSPEKKTRNKNKSNVFYLFLKVSGSGQNEQSLKTVSQ